MRQTLLTASKVIPAVTFLFSTTRRFTSAFVPTGTHIILARQWDGSFNHLASHNADVRRRSFGKCCTICITTTATAAARNGMNELTDRIYYLAGRDFEIGKPAVLSKFLFEELQVVDPNASEVISSPPNEESTTPGERRTKHKPLPSRSKAKSVSVASLSAVLKAEPDPVKRELVALVIYWLNAKAVARRGGFKACGDRVADRPDWTSQLIPDDDGLRIDRSALPVVLIDGHNIIFRSFHALPHLTTPEGTPVGAVLGFCNAMNKLVLQPWAEGITPRQQRVVVAFDTGEDNFRHDLYPEYKAGRAAAPEDLRPQFALIRKACEAYGFETADGEGFEADDVIATLAFQAVTSGATNVTIVSTDKDLTQLVTRRVNMLNCYTGERLGPEEVLAKHLAPPGRVADLLAIAGDTADGIKGAEGYGPVNAAKVLAKHATLEGAMEEICTSILSKKKDPVMAEETRSQILLARSLVDLRTDVPLASEADQVIGGTIQKVKARPFELGAGAGPGPLIDFMRDLGFQDLLRKTLRILGAAVDGLKL